jgi:tRNA (cytosine38-C5)-methyltransferase
MEKSERAAKKLKIGGEPMESLEIPYVEFYSGVGGWTMALEQALARIPGKNTNKLRRIAAFDNSDLCTRVFEHNFGSDKKAFNIERLTLKQVEDWQATIWAMSPPCQPHTRQHSNQEEDLNDPRSASFLHLCDLLEEMKSSSLPSVLFLENVVGFESSNSFRRWQQVLNARDYSAGHFQLTPTQVGLPNDRPRHFCVAVHSSKLVEKDPTLLSYLKRQDGPSADQPVKINTAFPEMSIVSSDDDDNNNAESDNLPTIATFLDDKSNESLRVPEKIVSKNAAWCFDILTPASRRSACFTSSYGKFIKGTGSVLYEGPDVKFELVAPEDREFEGDWAASIDTSKLRYFSGMEMARLMGYSESFSFPADMPVKQQWRLIGNSLNVRLASRIVEFGLRSAGIEGCAEAKEETTQRFKSSEMQR